MTAFTNGFLSVLNFDFTSPKRPYFSRNRAKTFSIANERERLGLSYSDNPWEDVGKCLRQAMSQFAQENGIDEIEPKK